MQPCWFDLCVAGIFNVCWRFCSPFFNTSLIPCEKLGCLTWVAARQKSGATHSYQCEQYRVTSQYDSAGFFFLIFFNVCVDVEACDCTQAGPRGWAGGEGAGNEQCKESLY